MRKCKALIDKTTTDVRGLEAGIPKLQSRSFPEQMTTWCQTKADVMTQHIADAQTLYNAEAVKIAPEACDTIVKKLETATEDLQTHFVKWKATEAAEIRKIVG